MRKEKPKRFRKIIFSLVFIISILNTYADGWVATEPYHQTLYADTITSRNDASSVNIADAQGLFVTGNINSLGQIQSALDICTELNGGRCLSNISGGGGNGSSQWTTSGTNIYNSNSGNIGMGTTNPEKKLHINGDFLVQTGGVNVSVMAGSGHLVVGGSRIESSAGFQALGSGRVIALGPYTLTGGSHVWDLKSTGVGFSITDVYDGIERFILDGVSGNIGIGIADPQQRVSVNGTIESTYGGFKFPDGTIQSTASGSGSGGSFWNSSGTNIYNSNSGNIGMGTMNPGTKLHVVGKIRLDGNDAGPVQLVGGTQNHAYIEYFPSTVAAGRKAYVGFPSSGSNVFEFGNEYAGGSFNFVGGDVRIGTSDSGYKLNIGGSIRLFDNAGKIIYGAMGTATMVTGHITGNMYGIGGASGDADNGFYMQSGNSMRPSIRSYTDIDIFTGGDTATTKMIIKDSGNVGIGTANPTSKLHLGGTAGVDGIKFPDGTLQTTAASSESIPSGMIAFFSGACPSGWTEYAGLRGRVIVGTPSGGTNEGTLGTALGNLAARTINDVPSHLHNVDPPATASGGQSNDHTHSGSTSSDGSHSHGINVRNMYIASSGSGQSTRETDDSTSNYFFKTTWGSAPLIGSSGSHSHSLSTGGVSAGHTHTTDIGSFSSSSAGSASVDVTMPYLQLTGCQKN